MSRSDSPWFNVFRVFPHGNYLNGKGKLILTLLFLSGVFLAVLMAFKATQPMQTGQTLPEDTQERIQSQQTSIAGLVNSRLKIEEEILRTDLNPGWVTNPGDLQKALLSEGARLRTVMYDLQNNRRNPYTFREDIAIIRLRARIETLKWSNMATRGERALIVYVDPSTGKKTHLELSPNMLQALALIRLIALNYSERDARQEYDLPQIAHDTLASQADHKKVWEFYLNSMNFGPVAVRHSNLDLFGREMIPSNAQIINPPDSQAPPSPAPQSLTPPTANPPLVPAPRPVLPPVTGPKTNTPPASPPVPNNR